MTRFSLKALSLLSLLSLLHFAAPAWAEKTDVVLMKNGDRITGEVKSLERGLLEFKTDHMGTVLIEWEEIQDVFSKVGQVVELSNGQRFYGPLAVTDNKDLVVIRTEQGEVGLSTDDVVTMYPVQASFWDRLDLSASLGFSWDKASSVGKYNLGIDAIYRNPRFVSRASAMSELTTQEDRDDTSRSSLTGSHLVFRTNKRYHTFFGNMERNDELGIDLRALVGAGYGLVPIRDQRNWLVMGAGLSVNHEIPTEGEDQTNLEAVAMLAYDYFRFNHPKRTFKTTFNVFPSITEFGRWRANSDTTLDLEFIKDLFWKMTLFATYDSEPLAEGASQIDYGLTSSLSYKF